MKPNDTQSSDSERLEHEVRAEEEVHSRARRAQARSELKEAVKKIIPEPLNPDGHDRRNSTT